MKKEIFVIPIDSLDVMSCDVPTDKVKFTMYCEMGSEDIDIDSPPVFHLVINREKGVFTFSTEDSDFSPEEEVKFKDSIDEFINDISKDFESGEIELPTTEEIFRMDLEVLSIDLPQH